ncbi:MAG TPA: hypothetical protein VK945_02225 [Planococcus sp. (in: firmicutes)]|nr:hypothetical protein [Planococcus sp. (in: firmicutes)]
MKSSREVSTKIKLLWSLAVFVILGSTTYYVYFHTPKNSLELYQEISFAEDFDEAQKLMLEGYEGNFNEEDFEFISDLNTSASTISQITLFEFNEKTFAVMTSPGTDRLKVLKVEELPAEMRDYFLQFQP